MTTLCLLKSSGRVLAYNWDVVMTSGFKTLYLVSNKKFLHTFLAKENLKKKIYVKIFQLFFFSNVLIMCLLLLCVFIKEKNMILNFHIFVVILFFYYFLLYKKTSVSIVHFKSKILTMLLTSTWSHFYVHCALLLVINCNKDIK